MDIHHTSDEISFAPLKREVLGYTKESFRHDAIAAITVALLTLPQAMAAALLAGLPLSSGLLRPFIRRCWQACLVLQSIL